MKIKTITVLLLALVICLSFAACSNNNDEDYGDDGDIAGADWRTWGIIDSYETMFMGSDEVNLCVCVNNDGADFYYDDDSQTLFASVAFPMTIENARKRIDGMSFGDIDQDEIGDFVIYFTNEDTEDYTFIWYWDDSIEQFVFSEEDSTLDPEWA